MNLPRPRIEIDLPGTAGGARVQYQERLPVEALLIGRPAHDVPAVLARLHAVCVSAHGLAATEAIERALGVTAVPSTIALRKALVLSETLREHALRIILDWSTLAGTPIQEELARRFLPFPMQMRTALCGTHDPFAIGARIHVKFTSNARALIDGIDALLTEFCFGRTPAQWLELSDPNAIRTWAARGKTPAAHGIAWLMNDSGADQIALQTSGDVSLYARYSATPVLRTFPEGSLPARHLARLIDLASLPSALRALLTDGIFALSNQDGIGTSRGALVHHCTLDGLRIKNYRTTTPTDVHFAPGGAAQTLIEHICAVTRNRPEQLGLVQAAVQAFDPCVPYDIRKP